MAKIRNFTFVGSGGAGKTSLIEQMLFNAKATTRRGKVDDGNTVMDFDPEEISRKMSISLSVSNMAWKDCHYNFIDTNLTTN